MSTRTAGTACAPSMRETAPHFFSDAESAGRSSLAPVTLDAALTAQKSAFCSAESRCAGAMTPFSSGSMTMSSIFFRFSSSKRGRSTELWSYAVVTTRIPSRRKPNMPRLSASVQFFVNATEKSLSGAPSAESRKRLQSSIFIAASRASR